MNRLLWLACVGLVATDMAWAAPKSDTTLQTPDPVAEARELAAAGKPEEGGAVLRKAIEACKAQAAKKPDDAENLYQLARLQMELQSDEEARDTIARAIWLVPKEAKYRLLKATLLRYADETEAALDELQQAARLAPGDPRYACELGQMLITLARDDEAAAAFKQALKAAPKHVEALTGLAFLLGEKQKYDEARALWTKALQIEPNSVFGHLVAAQLCHEQGLDAQAREHFSAILRIDAEQQAALSGMVQLCQSTGETAERDGYIARLYTLFRAKENTSPYFCRERFKVGEHVVYAYEYYELAGDTALQYRFDVSDAKGKQVLYRVSLGSYDITTQIAREGGVIKPGERMYHLDSYRSTPTGTSHRTYRMFTAKPTYEETRKLVGEVVLDKIQPASGTDIPKHVEKK